MKFVIFFLSFVLLLTACGESSNLGAQVVNSDSKTSEKKTKEETEASLPPAVNKVNTNTLNATLEDFNDPTIWDAPRLEFIRAVDRERGGSDWHIYSIDLDGKNVREVISYDDLSQQGSILPAERLYRSPNNRFLAGNFYKEGNQYIGLTNLKTKDHHEITRSLGPGRLAWAPDSKYIIFYGAKGAYKYTLETKSLVFFTKTFSLQLFILVDHTIMAVEYPGVVFYSQSVEKLEEIVINHVSGEWFGSSTTFRLSPSGRYLLAQGSNPCIYDLTLNHPDNQVYCLNKFKGRYVSFYSDSEIVKYGYGEKFTVLDFINKTERSKKLPDSKLNSLRLLDLINYGESNLSSPIYSHLGQ